MSGYGLPFVEQHQGCPHTHTKWVRCRDVERKRCLKCGGLLPTRLGIRHTAGKRKKLAREKQREEARAVAALITSAFANLKTALRQAAGDWLAPGIDAEHAPPSL